MVRPGSQSRRFTHIHDTVQTCYFAQKKIIVGIILFPIKKVTQYMKLQRCLKQKLHIYLKEKGERYASALTNLSFSNKVYKKFGRIYLKDYINFY